MRLKKQGFKQIRIGSAVNINLISVGYMMKNKISLVFESTKCHYHKAVDELRLHGLS